MNTGLISITVPLLVIVCATFTKRIILSLVAGILTGGILLAKGNIVQGFIKASEHIISATANEQSVYIIFFLFLFGAFAEIMKVSGGIKGFLHLTQKVVKTERGALAAVWAVTPFTFIDCCFHGIASGTMAKPLIDKTNGNRRRLAFILNVTSCLLIVLIPFGTTYVGYIVGVIGSALGKSGLTPSAYVVYLKSIPFNFYAIVMILISIGALFMNFGFKKEYKTDKGESDFEKEHGHDEAHEQCTFEEKAPPRPLNLIFPLGLLIASTVYCLFLTGRGQGGGFWNALVNADFEKSIFVSATATVSITCVFYMFQKVPLREIESHFLSGGNEMMPPIVVLILSWGLSGIIGELGFVNFMTGIVASSIPKAFVPAVVYLIGCLTSYFMGSAWGSWALIMPIAVPLSITSGANLALVIGAVLAGGSLGDNASPLGETAILSATISDIPLIEHVKSQFPFSMAGVVISTVLFVVFAHLV